MGKRRKPSPPSRARLAVLTTAMAGGVVLTAGPAQAEPTPGLAAVKEEVDRLNEEAEQSIERYNGFQEKQQKLQGEAGRIQEKVARGQDAMNELRTQLGGIAADQYRNGGIDPSVQLMLDADPGAYLARASAQNQVVDSQAALLRQALAEQRRLDQDRAEATATLAQLDQAAAALAGEKKAVQDKLAKAQALLNKLSAADRAKVNAQEAAATRASRSAAERPAFTGPVSGRAAAVVQFAYSQLGKPYVWGATGPSGYDCSGLTGAAYRAAGVQLPRVSQSQWNAGSRIARADLQPGDLVFFYGDLHHVGLYIGDGKMIHAPRTGKNVEVLPIDTMPYVGAVRP
ncbi:C40 family peptidase [Kitasatospora purpeofusca]|uniref:C40 family peptidase n=1 Tax=Kitasatospora purpeofusca TaxID=67352 RepID=UPI00224FBD96|nr:C40 family peptidase [Kitasatospora purpeofusca]MCX4758507.1 NlpC/P60 family protein [Kitasatospora purpeofusca]WSR31048.1 NlpC/P60 family protein [Kitasatospora purpeofusca]WSR39082.1 NlpC/P60 family protein [Kitasatospora purpeofusca]